MKSNKSISIAAITFTTIYFLFIIFISLFKGIHLYDIKLNNIRIDHLFIKIDKKLIYKADNITILPTTSTTKDLTSLHKKIYYFSKALSMFKEIDIKNVKYKNFFIKEIYFNGNSLKISSNKISLTGNLKLFSKYTIIKLKKLTIDNFTFKNIYGKIDYKNKIFFDFSLYLNNYQYYLNGDININTINATIKSQKGKFQDFDFKKLKAEIQYNKTLKIKAKADEFSYKTFTLKNLEASFIKDKLFFKAKELTSPNYKEIKNLKVTNLKGSYYKLFIANAKKVSLSYQNYDITSFDNSLIFKNQNNINFTSKKVIISTPILTKTTLIANNLIFEKLNDFIYINSKNNQIKNIIFNLYAKIIYSNYPFVYIPKIKGKIKHLNVYSNQNKIDLKKLIFTSEKLKVDKLTLSPLIYNIKNNTLFFNSTCTLNETASILKEFNISIPISQLKGNFEINSSISFDPLKINTAIYSPHSVFNYDIYTFSYDRLKGKLTNKLNLEINNFFFPQNNYTLKSDINLTATKDYLNANLLIKQLSILKLLNINSFKEKLSMDFKEKIIYLLNSFIVINIPQKIINILSGTELLKYSPLNKFISDFSSNIDLENSFITSNISFKKSPLINQNNISFYIDLNKSKIYNDFLSVNIDKNITALLKDKDLNIKNILFIIDTLKPLFENNSSKQTQPTPIFITTKNVNFFYNTFKLLSQEANVSINKEIHINSKYKKSNINGYSKKGYFLLEGNNFSKEELVALLPFFKSFRKINLDFVMVKSPDDFFSGKVYINKGIVDELKTLNNIVAFINTIPALLSLKNPGFSAKGYIIKKGFINYLFYKNILYFKQLKIIGDNIDFLGKGYIDLNTKKIKLKITARLKMKLKDIPVIGKGISYVLFGKDGSIDIKIVVKGDLKDPQVHQDIGKEILKTPFELFKRVITLPFNLL